VLWIFQSDICTRLLPVKAGEISGLKEEEAIRLPRHLPRGVILMIGDGMGFEHIKATRLSLKNAKLEMEKLPVSGSLTTYSYGGAVTDSAAAATALATGVKTSNGYLGMSPKGILLENVSEVASRTGRRVGLVTTVTVTHATPAAFAVHVNARKDEASIATAMILKRLDLIWGGGYGFFVPEYVSDSLRKDNTDVIKLAKNNGYKLLRKRSEMAQSDSLPSLGLFSRGALNGGKHEPDLAEMTVKAADLLAKDKRGFFLMVEGGKIDWAAHVHDLPGVIREIASFDKAISEAVRFAEARGDVMVLVVADHETGGLDLLDKNGVISADWTTFGHTDRDVPLYGYGPGAKMFAGKHDNTYIGRMLIQYFTTVEKYTKILLSA
jgi:alkaline phosphatase